MRYVEFKQYWQDKIDSLPLKAAFGEKQFNEMMASWGLTTSEEDLKKIRPLVAGTYCLAEDEYLFYEWVNEHEKALAFFLADEEHLKDALKHEWANHECGYTGNWREGVLALFDEGEIRNNALLKKVLPVAWREYIGLCE